MRILSYILEKRAYPRKERILATETCWPTVYDTDELGKRGSLMYASQADGIVYPRKEGILEVEYWPLRLVRLLPFCV